MLESQSSICAWADATFGPPVSDASIAARALHELAELVTACVHGAPAEEIGAEVADVVIVLARLGRALEIDVIAALGQTSRQPSKHDAAWHAANACGHLASVMTMCSGGWQRSYLGWCIGALAALARDIAIDLPAAIDAKMAVNRARKWILDGRGHGEHVRDV